MCVCARACHPIDSRPLPSPQIQHALNIARSGGFPELFCALVDAGKDVMCARLLPKERMMLYQDAVSFAARGGDRLLEASMATALGYAAERCAEFPKAEEAYAHRPISSSFIHTHSTLFTLYSFYVVLRV